MGMRACTKEDFQGLDKEFERMSGMNPKSLMCPDDITKLKLKNNPDDTPANTTRVNLVVTSCMGPQCETDETKIK